MNRQEQAKRLRLRAALHAIRLRHGVPADFYKATVSTPNFATGSKALTRQRYVIKQFVTFEVDLSRKFDYDIGWLRANSNFTYGGHFEVGDRLGIIDSIYLPNIVVEQRDQIVYAGKRYEVESVQELDAETGFIIKMKHISGGVNEQTHERLLYQQIEISDESALQ